MSDWRDIVRADVASLPSRGEADERAAGTTFKLPLHRLLIVASRARKMSPGSYLRRAVIAMIAHDLGKPFAEVLSLDPRAARETGYPIRDEEGTAFGPWEIVALREVADE